MHDICFNCLIVVKVKEMLQVMLVFMLITGDMEFKQNKFLPAEKQIVTAYPDINTVRICFPFV